MVDKGACQIESNEMNMSLFGTVSETHKFTRKNQVKTIRTTEVNRN
jgi:hypothetical protein